MLTIGTLPVLLKIVGKIDIKPIVEKLKDIDIFQDADNKEDAVKQLSKEKLGLLAFEILGEITPQLGKIADDLPALAAAYKGISIEEARKLDASEIINDLITDEGIKTFFKRALQKKAGQEA